MSVQLESRHYYKARDIVQHRDGAFGAVTDCLALYAVVEWFDGRREEIDQFDPLVWVVERAEPQ